MKYEQSDHLDDETQKEFGSIYTPKELALKMAKLLKWKEGPILDPCVGKGNLFVACLEIYKSLKNDDLYGVDLDSEAIKFCIKKFPGGHFQVGNCLEDDLADDDFWSKNPFDTSGAYKKKNFKKMFGRVK
jgi:type I restriction-modification system DNA methylase subunit